MIKHDINNTEETEFISYFSDSLLNLCKLLLFFADFYRLLTLLQIVFGYVIVEIVVRKFCLVGD